MENKPKRNDKERIIILKCRNRQLRDEVARMKEEMVKEKESSRYAVGFLFWLVVFFFLMFMGVLGKKTFMDN
mgnify:CR=1 FL=1